MLASTILRYLFILVLAIESAVVVHSKDSAMVVVVLATAILGVTAYQLGTAIYMYMVEKHTAHADIPASETSTIADASSPSPSEDTPPEKTPAALLTSPLLASDSFCDFAFAPRVPSPDPKVHYAIKDSALTAPQSQPALTEPHSQPAAMQALSGPLHHLDGRCSLPVADLAASSLWATAKAQQQPILPLHTASAPLPATLRTECRASTRCSRTR